MKNATPLRLLAFILVLVASSGCDNSSPILIGFSGQLTGKISEIGVYGRNGAMLATEVINASGGIDGRPLRLIAEDDGNTPDGALEADKKLLDAGVVAIIGHMTSSQSIAVAPLIEESNTVYVSPTSSTPTMSGKMDSFFRVMVENTAHGKELANYARSALDIDTVLTIADVDNKSYSTSFTDSFSNDFKEVGGKILKHINYSSRENPGWDSIIDSIIDLNPDAILLSCPAQDAVSLVQRMRTTGLTTKILSGAWAYTDKLLQWGGPAVEGMIFVINYAADNPNPAFVKFREAYRSRFGTNPNFAAAFGYEAVLVLAEGLKITHGRPEGLIKAMPTTGLINGVIGDFELNEFGDVQRDVFIVTIQEGEFRTVEMR